MLKPMTLEEAIFYNALTTALHGDYARLSGYRQKHSSWKTIWNELPREKRGSLDLEKEFKKLETGAVSLIMFDDPRYPLLLKEIPQPPFGLYVKGLSLIHI